MNIAMLEIAEADILKSLKRDNTWWLDGRASLPPDLRRRAYFEPFVKVALNWDVNRSVVLMGPRRVGKTVMLKQLVEHALSEGFPASQLFMVSLDTPLYSGMALERLLQLFEKQSLHDPGSRRVMIFDEIQYLKDWEVHLKVLTDRYPNTRFIASGSAAAALRLKSQESGAGRFTEFYLPPLTFAEFLDFKGIEDDLIATMSIAQNTYYAARDIHRLNRKFIEYLNYGGYPEAVLNEHIQQDVQRYLGRDIIDKVLLRDLPGLYGIQDVQELNRLFSTIAYHSGQELNLEGLATSSGVRKNTIRRYLEYLEAAFLIVRIRRVDDSGKTFQRNRNFKVYLTNPSMRCALFSPLREEDEAMEPMAETAVFSQWFHPDFMRNIHYARWKKGRQNLEVDLVVLAPSRSFRPSWAMEIKWSDRFVHRPSELKGLMEFARKNFSSDSVVGATSKTEAVETCEDNVRIDHFPCALYCYEIGRKVTESPSVEFPGIGNMGSL